MQLFRGFTDEFDRRGGYVAIGNFDGVHRGHQRMISTLVELAQSENVPSVVLTFDPHPIELLAPGRVPPSLSTLERKAELIASCGVDALIAYPTDRELLNLSPEDFFEQIIRMKLSARGLVEGTNFGFGKDRAGDVEMLGQLCKREGLTLNIIEPVANAAGEIVSSTAIRAAIRSGEIASAVAMLGHPYRLTGIVGSGAGRGASLGFPTANLNEVRTLIPPDGVYAANCQLGQECYAAAVHIGPNPTFAETGRKLEVHLLDYAGDLYEKTLSVDLIDRVRDTMRFDNAGALTTQLGVDLQTIRSMVSADRH